MFSFFLQLSYIMSQKNEIAPFPPLSVVVFKNCPTTRTLSPTKKQPKMFPSSQKILKCDPLANLSGHYFQQWVNLRLSKFDRQKQLWAKNLFNYYFLSCKLVNYSQPWVNLRLGVQSLTSGRRGTQPKTLFNSSLTVCLILTGGFTRWWP